MKMICTPVSEPSAPWLTVTCVGLSTDTTTVPAGKAMQVTAMPATTPASDPRVVITELAVVMFPLVASENGVTVLIVVPAGNAALGVAKTNIPETRPVPLDTVRANVGTLL